MSTKSYRCPCCGSNMVFDSETQRLHCRSCNNEIEMDTIQRYAETLESAESHGDSFDWEDDTPQSEGEWEEREKGGKKVYICPSCGAELDADESTAATKCTYCDSPVILPGHVSGVYHPDLIIPFQLDAKAVKKTFQDYCKSRKFLPRGFGSEHNIIGITGSYIPFWLFSCRAKGTFIYDALKMKTWQDDSYEYTQRDVYLVTRKGDMFFEHIPVNASVKMGDTFLEPIEPYEIDKAELFEEAYLSGYKALKYDLSKQKCRDQAEERIRSTFRHAMARAIDRREYYSMSLNKYYIDCTKGRIEYALLPVWTLDVEYKDKTYHYIINGQTGKLAGDLPTDRGLYWKYALSLFVGSSVIIYFVMLLLFL